VSKALEKNPDERYQQVEDAKERELAQDKFDILYIS
jgi:hypothetical protein